MCIPLRNHGAKLEAANEGQRLTRLFSTDESHLAANLCDQPPGWKRLDRKLGAFPLSEGGKRALAALGCNGFASRPNQTAKKGIEPTERGPQARTWEAIPPDNNQRCKEFGLKRK